MDKHEKTPKAEVQLRIGFEHQPAENVEISAYVFDPGGQFIGSAPVRDGQAGLTLSDHQIEHARVFFAPSSPKGRKDATPTLEVMQHRAAYEPVLKLEREKRIYEVDPVPAAVLGKWKWCFCRVRGRVVRPLTSQGVTLERPVCRARVHVCEVDAIDVIISRLPDKDLLHLRDELRTRVRFPPPPPPPPEWVAEALSDPTPQNLALVQPYFAALEPEEETLMLSGHGEAHKAVPYVALAAARAVEGPATSEVVAAADRDLVGPVLPETLKAALYSPSPVRVRNELLANATLLKPYLCLFRFFRKRLVCEEVAVIETDHLGRFDRLLPLLCGEDRPDLYFWVEYSIGGVWTPVYRPGMACATHWNYTCGREVTLRVTDPRVPWCGELTLPGRSLSVMSIGNNVGISQIQREGNPGAGLTTDGRPFGSTLELRVVFGDGLRPATEADRYSPANRISHYRWSYRKLGPNEWTVMDAPVTWTYGVPSGSNTKFLPYQLGPDPAFPGQTLFRIPPQAPPDNGTWVQGFSSHQDSASAFFPTALLSGGNADADDAHGLFELKLELFRASDLSRPVDLQAEGIDLQIPTAPAPYSPPFGTRNVPEQAGLPDMYDRVVTSEHGYRSAFRLVIHIDNRRCTGRILDVAGSGITWDHCGFGNYPPGAKVEIKFQAGHPGGFATFNFLTARGRSGTATPASAYGSVNDNPAGEFSRSGDVFKAGIDTEEMLDADCERAVFAQTLHVEATATNGWGRLNHLDLQPQVAAFALQPAPEDDET